MEDRRNVRDTLKRDHQEELVVGEVAYCKKKEVKRCHYEDWTKTKGTLALDGLHSNFITPQIIATSRPTRRAIEEHSLYKRLRELDVRLIVNLQQPFEHPKCAEEVFSQGFTYDLEHISCELRLQVLNPHWWKDNTPPSDPSKLCEIIEEMDKVLKEGGKVVVHCHAGQGRTGTVIAGYLMQHQGLRAVEAVEFVRNARPKAIIKAQFTFLTQVFEPHLRLQKQGQRREPQIPT